MSENKFLCGKIFCPFKADPENNECIIDAIQDNYLKKRYFTLLAEHNEYVKKAKASGEIVCAKESTENPGNIH